MVVTKAQRVAISSETVTKCFVVMRGLVTGEYGCQFQCDQAVSCLDSLRPPDSINGLGRNVLNKINTPP